MSLSSQRGLILITIKNSLTYNGIQLTLKFLGPFSAKCAASLSPGGFALPHPSSPPPPPPPPLLKPPRPPRLREVK